MEILIQYDSLKSFITPVIDKYVGGETLYGVCRDFSIAFVFYFFYFL